MKLLPILLVLAFIGFSGIAFSQTDKEKAKTLGQDGIKEFDNGNYDKAIELFNEALELDPGNSVYIYEKALSHYAKLDYQQAINLAEPLISSGTGEDVAYQLVGNAYDMIQQPDKAIEIYNNGLKKFPNSGKLYLEMGNVYGKQSKWTEAIGSWEKGVKVEPNYPSNYYQLAKIFSRTEEEIWALLYGEIFINLERNTDRTYEISKMIYDVYRQTIKISPEKGVESISITKNIVDLKTLSKDSKLPFEGTYELVLAISALNLSKGFNLENLYEMRESLVAGWFEKSATDFPNALLDWQKKVMDSGHFEAYSYWALQDGNQSEFKKWMKDNEEKFESFAGWMKSNKINIKAGEKYARTDYK
jgi:tetratricopeptide (TPR) repeat protein